MKFVIITGMSGAGKSQAVKNLEDLGFFCVDNLPASLIPKFAEICFQSRGKMEKIALVIDIRSRELLKDLFPGLSALSDMGILYEILFLEAADSVLIKRYKESRRAHPLSPEGRIVRGIKEERSALNEIKSKANHIIDTSNMTPRQFKKEITGIFLEGKAFKGMITSIISFGFKYGIPIDCDLVFDVRFVPNPYYIESMKRLTGQDEKVRDFVLNCDETTEFLNKIYDMLDFLIPKYVKEGKSQLVIGIGCTGGRHRSVAIADALSKILELKGQSVFIDHRDIEKDNRSASK